MSDSDLDGAKVIPDDDIVHAADELIRIAKKRGRSGGMVSIPLAESETDWIRDRFESYLTPHPDDFDDAVDRLLRLEAVFGSNLERFASADLESLDTAKNLMGDWEGRMATNLVSDHLEPMPIVAANHGAIAVNLRKNLEAMKAIYMSGRQDVLDIAEKGYEACDAVDDCDIAALKIFLSIALALGGIGGVFLGGASTAVQLGYAAINSGGSLADGFLEEGEKVELAADSVPKVLDKVREALDKVDERIRREEDEVIEKLKEVDVTLFRIMQDDDSDTPVMARRPTIADASRDEILDQFVQVT